MYYHLFIISAIFIILQSMSSYAKVEEIDLDFGKVSLEELSMKVYEKDTSASAVILGDYGVSRFIYNQTKGV